MPSASDGPPTRWPASRRARGDPRLCGHRDDRAHGARRHRCRRGRRRAVAAGRVVFAGPDRVTSVTVTPSDTRYARAVGVPEDPAGPAWDHETGASTGPDRRPRHRHLASQNGALTHPDLDDAARYTPRHRLRQRRRDARGRHGHGTHTAGTAAAESNNAVGVAGMNWVSHVYVCRIFDDFGQRFGVRLPGRRRGGRRLRRRAQPQGGHQPQRRLVQRQPGPLRRLRLRERPRHGALRRHRQRGRHAAHPRRSTRPTSLASSPWVRRTSADAVASFSNVGPAVSVVGPGRRHPVHVPDLRRQRRHRARLRVVGRHLDGHPARHRPGLAGLEPGPAADQRAGPRRRREHRGQARGGRLRQLLGPWPGRRGRRRRQGGLAATPCPAQPGLPRRARRERPSCARSASTSRASTARRSRCPCCRVRRSRCTTTPGR